jgi:hypothetical protein
VYHSKTRAFNELEQQIRDAFTTVSFDFSRKIVFLGLPVRKNVWQMLGPMLKSELKWLYMNFKMAEGL